MPRQLRYQVAMSLDGFIARPNGDYDWLAADPAIDFGALFSEFDTAVMGRKTYEAVTERGGESAIPGLDAIVFSRTVPAARHSRIRIVHDEPREVVAVLKEQPGRDIWLYGGGELFRTLLDAGLDHLDAIQNQLTETRSEIGNEAHAAIGASSPRTLRSVPNSIGLARYSSAAKSRNASLR